MNSVLIVVDMQNDFVTGSLGTKEAQEIVPHVIEKIRVARENGDLIIFTCDSHSELYLESREGINLPVEHCIRGTPGREIIPEIDRLIDLGNDLIINKPTFGSKMLCEEIQTIDELAGNSITEIELCGLCTGICVMANAVLLKTLFYEQALISVDAKACACVTPETHQTALAAMKLLQINIKEEEKDEE